MDDLIAFQGWLRKGLGRAVLHLKEHDSRPYKDAILEHCLHNPAYDRQCEDMRTEYLFDLMRVTGDEPYFRDAILCALTTEPEDPETFELGYILEIAGVFAAQDD